MLARLSGWRSHGFVEQSVPQAYERYLRRQLFEPWGRELLARAALEPGMWLIDIACGPGTVAQLAAPELGEEGRVVATDVSGAMLAIAAAAPRAPGAAKIEYVECSATALPVADGNFARAVCQQGLQFFSDRLGALREMRRVMAPDGVALVATWAAEHPLALFGEIDETMIECGIPEPYPHAFDADSYRIGATDLHGLMEAAGFAAVAVETVALECRWDSDEELAATVFGTPFGPLVAALDGDGRERVRDGLLARLGAGERAQPALRTVCNIGRGA
jgi:ubiquinone/menaquinone biosynthesis C-methylase UbiE